MSRFIDADKLSKQIEELYLDGDSASNHFCINNEDTLIGKFQVLDLIFDQPTADLEEVKHGEWIRTGWQKGGYGTKNPEIEYKCSECKRNKNFLRKTQKLPKYCSKCGARMDGGEE